MFYKPFVFFVSFVVVNNFNNIIRIMIRALRIMVICSLTTVFGKGACLKE